MMQPGWLQGGQNLNMAGLMGRPAAPAPIARPVTQQMPGSSLNMGSLLGAQPPNWRAPYEPFPQLPGGGGPPMSGPIAVRPTPAPVRPIGPAQPIGGGSFLNPFGGGAPVRMPAMPIRSFR